VRSVSERLGRLSSMFTQHYNNVCVSFLADKHERAQMLLKSSQIALESDTEGDTQPGIYSIQINKRSMQPTGDHI